MYGDLEDKTPQSLPDRESYGVTSKFYNNYRDVITPAQKFNMYNFTQIGMHDPFPEEKMESEFVIPVTEEDLVYRENRYIYKDSPNMLYFPSKMLLFKIMRACIGIDIAEDLWFN